MKRSFLVGLVQFFFLWEIVIVFHLVDTFFLPDPITVLEALYIAFQNEHLGSDLLATLSRVFSAFFLSITIGLPLGLFLGSKSEAYAKMEFGIDFFRSTPPTALFPLFLLLFGATELSKVLLAAFASTLIILFNTAHGVIHAQKSRLLAVSLMGATKSQIFRWILFWESLPQTFLGLRGAISFSLIVIIVTEMFIGTNQGLGRRIIDAQITYEIPTLYAVIFLTGALGYLFNLLFHLLEKNFLHWIKI